MSPRLQLSADDWRCEFSSDFSVLMCPVLSLFLPHRWKPEHGQWHQQPGAVAHSLPEEAGARWCAIPDGSAPPGDPRGGPPPAHHPDEVRWRLRLQGGVWGRTQPSCHPPWRLQAHIKPGHGNAYQSNMRLHLYHGVQPVVSSSACFSVLLCTADLFCSSPDALLW